jgi:dipeptidyl aminopeptidase/acylaminoacyl peptidase
MPLALCNPFQEAAMKQIHLCIITSILLVLTINAYGAEAALSGFEAFAQEPAMEDAKVSPNGKHLATLQRFAKDGKQFLLIYDAKDISKKPVTLGSTKMDIVAFSWVNNERVVVRFRQDVDTLQRLGADTRLVSKLATIDRKGKRWLEIPRKRADRRREFAKLSENFGGAGIFDTLPKDDDHILISYDDDQNGVADIYKVHVKTGSASRVVRNSSKITVTYIDDDGDPRLATTYDEGDAAIIYLARLKGDNEWIEIGRTVAGVDATSQIFNAFRLVGPPSSNEFYVLSNHETDTAAIYTYDLTKRAFGELQFRHPRYDARGVRTTLDDDKNDKIIGFTYTGKAGDVYLVDPEEKARYDAIDQILPDTTNAIVSRSDDGDTMVIRAEGPKMPRSWYLLKNNRLDLLGRSMPFLTEDILADVEWVRYKARDGLDIPALVTVPNGEAPFPVVVLPHGGPVARDYWGFDVWAQMLAYHGYLVIQPQFRISEGFGRKHLEAGYARWGYEMQDDLDDAIGYLAKRKLADPNRAAIFGWSYGGYAAFVGAMRDPNPYKCAIAGAGVADVPYFRAWLADSGTFTEKTYRTTVDGMSPLDHVDSVDVPILVIHGDIDERVPVAESRKFVNRLKQFEKQHKYLELEGANHFFGTIYYRHYMEMYPAMIDWLDNTCGLKSTAMASP